ncbi:uncharacterized protein LOC135309840 isoform X2 [Plodia interpunctella]|uniref:uncharacterized protein LOC135309840 isoform X2 n=1 Tax=Plodia interpunctella TaxID=58824 RepID=UPI003100F5FD
MNEHKIILLVVCMAIYCLYSLKIWLKMKDDVEDTDRKISDTVPPVVEQKVIPKHVEINEKPVKRKINSDIPLFINNGCSVLEVFTKKPDTKLKLKQNKLQDMEGNNGNAITVIGITVFLVILVLSAFMDVLKVKEEERAMLKLNPNGERRQSLAEFANKKSLRRESSKFGLQLFQIAESFVNGEDENKTRRESRPYTRGESTTSYFSEKKIQSENSAPASIGETASEPKLIKRQSAAKLIGARPVPMVRRSSFPALPLNPEVQALMLGNRQPSFDSDDEDGKGRRVRIIRRY